MDVRLGRGEDALVVAALVKRFLSEEGFDVADGLIAGRAERFLREPANRVLLACEDDEAVGLATVCTRFGFEGGFYAEIEDLYVAPGHRRAGTGRQLVEAAVTWCREHDCESVEVVITPEGEAAHDLTAWYGRLGFAPTGRTILDRPLRHKRDR